MNQNSIYFIELSNLKLLGAKGFLTVSVGIELTSKKRGANSMSGKRAKVLRLEAIKRYEAGETATEICRFLRKSPRSRLANIFRVK